MTDIVAGRFEQQTEAQAAIEKLLRRGFRRDDVSSFFVNPPGQHGRFAVGGDRNVSPGARGAGLGALARLQDRRKLRRGKGTTEVRPAGIMVAAHTPTASRRSEAVRALQSSGAVEVEAAKGDWHDGRWADFDPTTPPTCVSVSTR